MHPRDEVKKEIRRAFIGGPLSFGDVETVLVPERRLRKAADPEEIKDLRMWEVRDLLPRLLRANPDAALDLVSALLGLGGAGLVLAVAPRADAPGAAVRELVEAGAAVGAVQAAGLEALADGSMSVEEAAGVARLTRAAERELVQVGELCRTAQVDQLALAVGGAR